MIVERPLQVLAVVAAIVVGKSSPPALVLLLRYPLNTALTVSASLAQIGEFSFILAALGVSLQPAAARGPEPDRRRRADLDRAQPADLLARRALQALDPGALGAGAAPAQRDDPLAELPRHTEARYLARQVLVGHGPRRPAHRARAARGRHGLRGGRRQPRARRGTARQGLPAVSGDAAEPAVLIQAHIAQAALLVIAVPDALGVRRMIETARTLNPQVQVAVRSHNADEAKRLAAEGGTRVFLGEEELASHAAPRTRYHAGHTDNDKAPGG